MKAIAVALFMLPLALSAVAQPYEGPDTLWTRVNPLPDLESFHSRNAVLLSDGGVMISGSYVSLGETDWGPCMVRLDSNGYLLWRRPCHDSVTVTGLAPYMCQATPNLFILVGTLYRHGQFDLCITGCDSEGGIVWQQALSLPYWQIARGVCAGSDGFAVVVYDNEFSTDSHVAAAMKVDTNGNVVWANNYSPTGGNTNVQAVIPTADGGFLVLGGTESGMPFLKLDTDGNVLICRSYHFPFDEYGAWEIVQLTNGDFVYCGYALSYAIGYTQALLFRVSSSGDSLWSWYSDPNNWQAVQVLATSDGGFLAAVNLCLRFSSSGILLWQRGYSPPSYAFQGADAMLDACGRLTVAGSALSDTFDGYFVAALRTQPDPVAVNDRSSVLLPGNITLSTYPNPFNSSTYLQFTLPSTQRVSLRLYDVLGREVAVLMNEIKTAGKHEMMFDAAGLPSGVYLCRLEAGGLAQTRKMMLIK